MARPRIHDEPRITTAIRFPESVHRLIIAKALRLDVSVNYLVNRAVEDFLDKLDFDSTRESQVRVGGS